MSLADDFLADLDDYEDADVLTPAESNTTASTFASTSNASHKADHLMDEDDDEDEDDFDEATAMDTEADSALEAMMREVAAAKRARDIAKLMDSDDMNGILKVQTTKTIQRLEKKKKKKTGACSNTWLVLFAMCATGY